MKVVRLSALRTGRLYPQGNVPGTHFCYRLSPPHGHSVAGRIMSTKNLDDTTGNQTRDLRQGTVLCINRAILLDIDISLGYMMPFDAC